MGFLQLKGDDWQRINDILGSSFNVFELNQFVTTKFSTITGSIPWMSQGGMKDVVFQLVDTANRNGILDQLLVAASNDRPFRPDMRALTFHYSKTTGWSAPLEASGLNVAGALEGLTSAGNPFVDTTALVTWLIRAERQVCLVRCGTECGTGWLVGPDLVLTCYHVVEKYLKGTVPATGVQVKFDYRRTPVLQNPNYDGPNWVNIDANWTIPNAPYSPADLSLVGDPDPAHLDFAMLKLATAEGNATPHGEEKARGWADLSAAPHLPMKDDPMLIVGHPANDTQPPPQMPLQASFSTPGFDKLNPNNTRVIYTPSSKKGSSGSPVFDRTFRPVALHHNRGQINPNAVDKHLNNRGIPLGPIRAAIIAEKGNVFAAPPA